MKFFDTHTHHRPYSLDGRQSLDELLDSAVASRLSGILLTDHDDFDFPAMGDTLWTFDRTAAHDEWDQCIGRPRTELDVRFGIEIGYQPHLKKRCNTLCNSGLFDGVILSLHLLDGCDPFTDKSVYASGKLASYTAYFDAMIDMMHAIPGPAIVGHFDYFSRYAPFADSELRYSEMPTLFDRFFTAVLETGKCLEFNIRSMRRKSVQHAIENGSKPGLNMPDREIFRRYVELGGRMVSLGSDAHQPGECGQWFAESAAFLSECGVRALTHFEKGNPHLTEIT